MRIVESNTVDIYAEKHELVDAEIKMHQIVDNALHDWRDDALERVTVWAPGLKPVHAWVRGVGDSHHDFSGPTV